MFPSQLRGLLSPDSSRDRLSCASVSSSIRSMESDGAPFPLLLFSGQSFRSPFSCFTDLPTGNIFCFCVNSSSAMLAPVGTAFSFLFPLSLSFAHRGYGLKVWEDLFIARLLAALLFLQRFVQVFLRTRPPGLNGPFLKPSSIPPILCVFFLSILCPLLAQRMSPPVVRIDERLNPLPADFSLHFPSRAVKQSRNPLPLS